MISIIIPVHNQFAFTYGCLKAIARHTGDRYPFEVIVVDDLSTDETTELSQWVAGVRVHRNDTNLGFNRSCMAGSSDAKGRYLLFLNNDTVPLTGWLEALVSVLERDPTVGAAGSLLLNANGTVQEAGGIVFFDGEAWNAMRGSRDGNALVTTDRDVDYVSGASLIIRRDLFIEIGGFDPRYIPAYYEDTNLCFEVRRRGLSVRYIAQSRVVHFEGATSGRSLDSGVKRHQVANRAKFVEKWSDDLKRHFVNSEGTLDLAMRRLRKRPTVLVIDDSVPTPDRDSGSVRMSHVLDMLLELGCSVVFVPADGSPIEPYTSNLKRKGIEVVHKTDRDYESETFAQRMLAVADIAWICRPNNARRYLETVRHRTRARIVYDTIDLHYVRLKRQQELGQGETGWDEMRRLELLACRRSDRVLVVTDVEQRILEAEGVNNVGVLPNVHLAATTQVAPFDQREGLLFIGGYNHHPNIDAAVWFAKEIAPLIWAKRPEIKITLLGSMPTPEVHALASDRISVPGYLEDVSQFFQSHRIFVSPLRYGAGMKGKLGQSLSLGLPVVSTSVGTEGMGLRDGVDVIVAEDAPSIAEAVLRLYDDKELWNSLSAAGQESMLRFTPDRVKARVAEILRDLWPPVGYGRTDL